MRDLIEHIAQELVDNPSEVGVKELTGDRTTVYELRVGSGDLGKVIGKGGRHARAMRTLLNAIAAKHDERVVLEIIE